MPDILLRANLISRFMKVLKISHLKVVTRILWYIKRIIDYGIFYSSFKRLELIGYNDNDWVES